MASKKKKQRCGWAKGSPLEVEYHDSEWGVPHYEDNKLFECITLEGAQAGLSWATILKKRENYRKAFADFEIAKVARFTEGRVERLLGDAGIVRHRGKIESTIKNAKATLTIQKEFGSFSDYLWDFVGGEPIQNKWKTLRQLPSQTDVSISMSKDLRKRGFSFVGPTTCYAFMQAVGMVNDHEVGCFRHRPLA